MLSVQHAFPVVLDVLMHSVWCQIEFPRPRHRTHFNPRFREPIRVNQMSKNPAIKVWSEAHNTFDAIDKTNLHRPVSEHMHLAYAPRRFALERRHYGRGAIFTGGMPVLAASHAASNSC